MNLETFSDRIAFLRVGIITKTYECSDKITKLGICRCALCEAGHAHRRPFTCACARAPAQRAYRRTQRCLPFAVVVVVKCLATARDTWGTAKLSQLCSPQGARPYVIHWLVDNRQVPCREATKFKANVGWKESRLKLILHIVLPIWILPTFMLVASAVTCCTCAPLRFIIVCVIQYTTSLSVFMSPMALFRA